MVAGKILLAGDFASLEPSPAFIMVYAIIGFAFQESYSQSNMALLLTGLSRIFHELLSRDHETGNPLAGLSGAQRARIRWACHAQRRRLRRVPGNRRGLVSVPQRYVAGTDTRGRQEARPHPWSQQVIHEISGLVEE